MIHQIQTTPPMPPGKGFAKRLKRGAGSSPGQPHRISRVWQKKEQQAAKYLQQGRLEEAEVIYRALIEEGVTSHTILVNLAIVCAMQGRAREAIPLFKEAIAIKPDDSEICYNLGIALNEQGDLQGAIDGDLHTCFNYGLGWTLSEFSFQSRCV